MPLSQHLSFFFVMFPCFGLLRRWSERATWSYPPVKLPSVKLPTTVKPPQPCVRAVYIPEGKLMSLAKIQHNFTFNNCSILDKYSSCFILGSILISRIICAVAKLSYQVNVVNDRRKTEILAHFLACNSNKEDNTYVAQAFSNSI